jgi:hypothetical protein
MDNLVFCWCGHGIGRHGEIGCKGDRQSRCFCMRTPGDVVDQAIDDARSRHYFHDDEGTGERHAVPETSDRPLTFEEFVFALLEHVRRTIPYVKIQPQGGRVVCSWPGWLVEMRPGDADECVVGAHSLKLRTSAHAVFKLRVGAVPIAVDFALLGKSRCIEGRVASSF